MEEYYDEDENVNSPPAIEELIYRCAFTSVAYCKAGGHFLIVYGTELYCPVGCND
jgi:hypothetical protein